MMGLFGNSLEAQLGRALFQQDLYRRMFDAYEHRKSAEYIADKKAEEEFWGNYNKLLDSIVSAKSDLDNFYQRTDLHLIAEVSQIKSALNKLEELRKDFIDKFNDIPKGDEATGWAFFASRESQDYESHLKEDFIPYALSYFKILTTHLWSIQPILLMEKSLSEAKKSHLGPIEDRLASVLASKDLATLDFDRDGWNASWTEYENKKNMFYEASYEIVKTWDPWKEKDIEAILTKYALTTTSMKSAGDNFTKHLERVEKKLEKIWEIKKSVEISSQAVKLGSQELDNFSKIEKLAKLLEAGAITKAEFAAKKAELLKGI
jgi:hypothetical protein